jgi:hypothetical protein
MRHRLFRVPRRAETGPCDPLSERESGVGSSDSEGDLHSRGVQWRGGRRWQRDGGGTGGGVGDAASPIGGLAPAAPQFFGWGWR